MSPGPSRRALVAIVACTALLALGARHRDTLSAGVAETHVAQQRFLPLIDVDPGPLARPETIVSFALPPTVTGESLQLRSTDDERTAIPLQITRERRAWFIARNLRAGEVVRYRI